jgi:hypothetical protein
MRLRTMPNAELNQSERRRQREDAYAPVEEFANTFLELLEILLRERQVVHERNLNRLRFCGRLRKRRRYPWRLKPCTTMSSFFPSQQFADAPFPNRFFAVADDNELKVRGLESRCHDTPPLLNRMQ